MNNTSHSQSQKSAAPQKSSLSSLQPIDSSPFKPASSFWMVWGSVFLMWLLALLPWRLWLMAPDLLLMVLCFWHLHEPRRVNMLSGFVLGLLLDVHGGALLGEHALSYVLAIYGVGLLRRRLLLFGPWVQLIHLLPIWLLAFIPSRFAHAWLAGEWAGWDWLWSAVFMAALWPIADLLLLLPHRLMDEDTESSA
ncbi:MAG: rod shape-determining protein MreD [Alcaligenaceae bacterium]|nr:rod shape-determining protein MreD [Alcaligenaceae bacterium]